MLSRPKPNKELLCRLKKKKKKKRKKKKEKKKKKLGFKGLI